MMRSRQSQLGLSFVGWFLVLMAVGGIASVFVRMAPHYLEFRTIVSVMESLDRDEDITSMSKAQLVKQLRKRFEINNVRGFDFRNHLKLSRTRNVRTVTVAYDVREHLFGNIDVVLNFHRDFEKGGG